MVAVREAKLEDEAQVFDLLRQLMTSATEGSPVNQPGGSSTYRAIIENGNLGTIFVAEEDGTLLGLVTLSYPLAVRCGGTYSCIEEFIVNEKARGKGVGGGLLEAAIARAKEMGCAELQVNHPSEIGYPVYIRHGWEDLGKHLNLYPARRETT